MAAALPAAACEQPATHTSQSLVGAKSLPPETELSRETIEINSGYGDISVGFLSYQLRANNTLVVTLTDRRYPEPDRVLVKDTFELPAHVATEVRQMLWRVRPEKLVPLADLNSEARPVGCSRRGPHDFGELAVVFMAEGPKPGVDDDRLGDFELPRPKSCDTPEAVAARKLMQQVLDKFPHSKAPAELRRREAEFSSD